MKTDNTTLKKLTRGEEEVMQILWQLGAGSINDLIAAMQEPKPKYTTIVWAGYSDVQKSIAGVAP